MALVSEFPAINVVPCNGRGSPTDGWHLGSWAERRGGARTGSRG